MIGTIATITKTKAVLTALSIILLGSALVDLSEEQGTKYTVNTHQETVDPFTKDIQERADLVYNAVLEAKNMQGQQKPIAYKQTCESSISFIQKERLNTENNYNTLNPDQKELIQEYREYLKESAYLVSVCYSGANPDFTKIDELKAELK